MGAKAVPNGKTCANSRLSTSSTTRTIGDHRFFRESAFAALRAVDGVRDPVAGIAQVVTRRPYGAIATIIAKNSPSGVGTPRPCAIGILGHRIRLVRSLRWPYDVARSCAAAAVIAVRAT